MQHTPGTKKKLEIPLFELILSLSSVLDLIDPHVANHHLQTACCSYQMARMLDFSPEKTEELVLAASLHDCGIFSLSEKTNIMNLEAVNPHHHAETGYGLLKTCEPLKGAAEIIRFHHLPWQNGAGQEFRGIPVPPESHLLQLADRVSVLAHKGEEILGQSRDIIARIIERSGSIFKPDLVDAFKAISGKESFWLDLASPHHSRRMPGLLEKNGINVGDGDLIPLTNLFSRIIDFRSPFTANHSSGVAACAAKLSSLAGFADEEVHMMNLAGNLHDLGKVSVPSEILEKPAALSQDEINVVRGHTYHTFRILEPINDLAVINEWASFHHENLDGNGYPFHLRGEEISAGSRIMAVADVFTAITEDRPYRKGMPREKATALLENMVEKEKLDGDIVLMVKDNYDDINEARQQAQNNSAEQYRFFRESLLAREKSSPR